MTTTVVLAAPPRTVVLVRVSTERDQSTAAQVTVAQAWCHAHGLTPEIRAEEGVHGDSTDRPELERIMTQARLGEIGTIVVVALDRLGRSAVDLIMRLDELRKLKVRVVSLREGLDFSTPIGAMIAAILAYVAELELHSIRERTRAGLNGWQLPDGRPCEPLTPGAVRVAVRSRKKLGRPAAMIPVKALDLARQRMGPPENLSMSAAAASLGPVAVIVERGVARTVAVHHGMLARALKG